jgi:hypothetical protein
VAVVPEGRIATRLGCTDGQVWTLGLVLAVSIGLVPATFPAGLRPHGDVVQAALPEPSALPALPAIPLPGAAAPPAAPAPQPLTQPDPVTPSSGAPTTAASARPAVTELQIIQGGWYDAGPDATVRTQLTPAGELPVSSQADKPAATVLLRLQGTATVLDLRLDTDSTRTNGTGALQLCRNRTSTWTGYDAMPASAAPPVDERACVAGVLGSGLWRFDLLGLGPPDAATGFTVRATAGTFVTTFVRKTTP